MERLVGNYALERLLGQGGMGAVWLGRRNDGRFEGRAAIKFLDLTLLDAEGVARFRREGEALARLEHAGIARLIDSGVSDEGQPYLVLEYVEGEVIDRWCASRALDARARVELFLEVLAAVVHAHSKLILHRDLKPANILVTPDGHVKLLDFGTAKLLDVEQTTHEGFTLDYAAPEQVQNGEVTTATDVYALGVILYELLTRRHPTAAAAAATPIAKARAIVEAEPPRALRGDVGNILALALRKEPEARYQTVEAFAADLQHYLRGEPVRARADSAWYRFSKFVSRNRIAAATAVIVLVAVSVAGVISVQQRQEATLQRDRARALAARSGAVIDFVNAMLADAAPAQGPVSIASMMESSYAKLSSGNTPPEHEAVVLALLAQFFANNSSSARTESLLARALELTANSPDRSLRGQLLCQNAGAAILMGRLEKARALVAEGMKLVGDDDLAAVTCFETDASVARASNDAEQTLVLVKRAQERLRQSGIVRRDWAAVQLARLADAYAMRGNTVEAERHYAQSLAQLDEIGRGESIATFTVRARWAGLTAQSGDTLGALDLYEQLLRIVNASSLSGKPPAYIVGSRGAVLSQLARYPEALVAVDEAVELSKRSNSTVDIIIDSAVRADIHVSMGNVAAAVLELRELQPLIDKSLAPDSSILHRVKAVRARIEAVEGRLPAALALYSELIERPDIAPAMQARALLERADVYLRMGKSELALADAHRDLQVARGLQRDKPYSSYTGRALLALARCHQARSAHAEARTAAAAAINDLAMTLGDDHPDTRSARQLAAL